MNRTFPTLLLLASLAFLSHFSTAYATTYYVPDDFAGIQLALDSVLNNDEIVVRDGIYYENIVWPAKIGIILRSENGRDNCVIDGGGASDVVTFSTGIGTTTIFQGFKVMNGTIGMVLRNGSAPHILDCIVQDNLNHGISIDRSSPIIENNTIMRNGQHGIYLFWGAGTITNNTIKENQQRGLYCSGSGHSPTVTGNTIESNEEGGVYLNGMFALVIGNIVRNHNVSGDGGAFYVGADFIIECKNVIANNLIYNNAAWRGGAMIISGYRDSNFPYDYFDMSKVINNVIDQCSANNASIFVGSRTRTTLMNNIITNTTTGYGIDSISISQLNISHNNLWNNFAGNYRGCTGGEGAISEDPLYLDPTNKDYHIGSGSPIIDAGTNDVAGLPDTDFDGNPRIVDGDENAEAIVDMGAYEYNPDSCIDNDEDGYGNPASEYCEFSELDCDDSEFNVNPAAAEICDNGIDDDCDGLTDCIDGGDPDCDCPTMCAGSAEASTYQSSPIYASSDLAKHLAFLFIPVGAVILLRILRRKR